MDLDSFALLGLADRNSGASARTLDSKTEPGPTSTHSRNSSTGSNVSSPFNSVFSSRSHSRWPSSASSLITSPDSPPVAGKSALHDLVEEPADGEIDPRSEADALEDFCLCDSIFCEHRRVKSVPGTPLESSLASIDQVFDLGDYAFDTSSERRSSDGSSRGGGGGGSTLLHRRLPSISRRWRRRKTASSASAAASGARSAPPSRSPSFRNLNWKNSIVSPFHSPRVNAVRGSRGESSIFDTNYEPDILDDPFFLDLAKESVDDAERAPPTPLLPPFTSPSQPAEQQEPECTLPSPPLRARSAASSILNSPISCPTSPALWSPALSTRPSATSIRTGFSLHGADIPPSSPRDFDKWAIKLGHANFHISPEPYLPESPASTETCLRLREDWESARVAFMRQAALIAEHYGLASRTYALTCEKWEEVDSLWRTNFEKVRSEASDGYDGESLAPGGVQSPDLRPLPETQAVLHMPSLDEEKFPAVDAADIIGPMVRYETFQSPQQQQRQQEKKGGFLRSITDPASLLRKS